jgi:hypothetical protein
MSRVRVEALPESRSDEQMSRQQRLSLLLAIVATFTAAAEIYRIVPRIKLVEAVTLFASAFGAGAALTALFLMRRVERR